MKILAAGPLDPSDQSRYRRGQASNSTAMPGDPIATADAGILDRCGPWVDLARLLVETVPGAFVVDLG